MTRLTKEYFDEAIKSLATKQDMKKLEAAIGNVTMLAISVADDLGEMSEQLADVQEDLEWNTFEVGALADKSVPDDVKAAFK